jgi:hypothetical protein
VVKNNLLPFCRRVNYISEMPNNDLTLLREYAPRTLTDATLGSNCGQAAATCPWLSDRKASSGPPFLQVSRAVI